MIAPSGIGRRSWCPGRYQLMVAVAPPGRQAMLTSENGSGILFRVT